MLCYDNKISYKRRQDRLDFGVQDVAIVTTDMMLKITELGLGSCWVGSFYPNKVSEIFNFEDNIVPVAILLLDIFQMIVSLVNFITIEDQLMNL